VEPLTGQTLAVLVAGGALGASRAGAGMLLLLGAGLLPAAWALAARR
jgi:hypothetical protein